MKVTGNPHDQKTYVTTRSKYIKAVT